MSNYKALVIGILLLFVFGGILPAIMSSFSEVESYDYKAYNFLTNVVEDGIKIPIVSLFTDVRIRIPSNSFGDFIVSQINGFSLIPPFLGIPLIILTSLLIVYGIVKLFLP